MNRITLSQAVSIVSVTAGAVLAVLQGMQQIHAPAWVFAVLTALVSLCRSLSPTNSGGPADPKAVSSAPNPEETALKHLAGSSASLQAAIPVLATSPLYPYVVKAGDLAKEIDALVLEVQRDRFTSVKAPLPTNTRVLPTEHVPHAPPAVPADPAVPTGVPS